MLREREITPSTEVITNRFRSRRLAWMAEIGFDAKERWLSDHAGRQTYTMESGEGACPKVLIHGGLSEGSEWFPLAGTLGGRVVIPDRPGCGLTYKPDPRRGEFRREAVRWMETVVDSIGAPQVDLVGNSLGGYFSLLYALAHPDRVRRLALVGAPAGLHRSLPLPVRLWGRPLIGRLIGRPVHDPEKLRRVFGELLVSHPERVPVEALEVMAAATTLPGAARFSHLMLGEVTTWRGVARRLLIEADIAHLGVPAMFVWGEEDGFSRPADADRIWDRMPRATLRLVPDAGHLPQLDQPEIVAAAVNTFLGQSERSPK